MDFLKYIHNDVKDMYTYTESSNPLDIQLVDNIELQKDELEAIHPFVPRLCSQQGYMLIWYTDEESDPILAEGSFKAKGESQWVNCKDPKRVEKAVALVWPHDDYFILGAVKYPSYMRVLGTVEIRNWMKKVWDDINKMMGHKTIVCPSGTYLECIHLYMNQMRIPKETYHYKLMRKKGFKRQGEFWVREPK